MNKKTYTEVTTKQTMNRVTAPSMPFHWSINPYRGCAHGCSFCYARATHTFLGMNADDSFQNNILLKANAPEALKYQLERVAKRFKGDLYETANHVGLVAIGTATDPYQPIEAKQELTRECLKILAKYGIPTTITTRSPLILRDIDILKDMYVTSVNISVSSLNRDVWRQFEPATSHPNKRFEIIQRLNEEGIHTGLFLAPILPFITDGEKEMQAVFHNASLSKAQFVMPSVLRLAPEVKSWFFKSIEAHYPHLLAKYAEYYRSSYPPKNYVQEVVQRANKYMDTYSIPSSFKERDDWRESWSKHQKWNEPSYEQLSLF